MRVTFDNLTHNEFRALHQALAQHVENVECSSLAPEEDDCDELWFDDEGNPRSHAERLLEQLDARVAGLANNKEELY